MNIIGLDRSGRPIVKIPIYYDVPDNRIRATTFITTAEKYERLLLSVSKDLLLTDAVFQLYVLPPQPGSFRQVLGVVFIAATGGIFAAGGWSVVDGFIEGLTGEPPRDWAESLGQKIRDSAQEKSTDLEEEISEETLTNAESTAMVIEVTRQIVSNTNETLISSGLEPEHLPEIFSAKADLYYGIEVDPQVRGIGFGEEDEAPIRREDFARHQIHARRDAEAEWVVSLEVIRVSSPNWDRYDNRRRWKGLYEGGTTVYFTITDDQFWEEAQNGEIISQINDELIAQVATRFHDGRPTDRIVLRVLRYNDKPVSKELLPHQVEDFLLETSRNSSDQNDLFE